MAQQSQTLGPLAWSNEDIGNSDWANPSNAVSSDNAYAVSTVVGVTNTDYLRGETWGFRIPPGATIDGFLIEVEGKQDYTSANQVQATLVSGTAILTSSQSFTLTTTEGTVSAGGSTNTLGWASPDPSVVMGTAFALRLQATNGAGGTVHHSIDYARLTVYYTPGALAQSGFIY